MKKVIVFLFVFLVLSVFINEKENILIPNDAIRFRVIASSNNKEDQKLKIKVKNEVERKIYKLIKNAKNIEEARKIIGDNLGLVKNILDKYNINYEVNYGYNYFPNKTYRGVEYSKGLYESLVITIDKGLGENWWCVLFPPLCLLDEENNLNNREYTFYVKELINNYKR